LLGFGVATVAWFVAAVLGLDTALAVLAWLVLPPCVLVAGYTAFLFGQAEGRDLWQSRWLLPHLLAQGVMVGAGAVAVAAALVGVDSSGVALVARLLVLGAVAHLVLAAADLLGAHPTANAAVAASTVVRGRYARLFWGGAVAPVVLGALLAGLSWSGGAVWAVVVAGVVVQPGLLVYETVYVRAAQEVPLS
ncbi:MAG: NrfD/PsrC family molybdoenzyme membrane anchor subunit, partial [Thermocrispum sp.]